MKTTVAPIEEAADIIEAMDGKQRRTIGADLITTGVHPRHGAVMIVQTLTGFAMIGQG